MNRSHQYPVRPSSPWFSRMIMLSLFSDERSGPVGIVERSIISRSLVGGRSKVRNVTAHAYSVTDVCPRSPAQHRRTRHALAQRRGNALRCQIDVASQLIITLLLIRLFVRLGNLRKIITTFSNSRAIQRTLHVHSYTGVVRVRVV